jgi:ABC-type polysaccharide/polyol phosphate transport system ATPase subunit
MDLQQALTELCRGDVTMAELALEVDHLTKNFRLHREKTNSLKALIAGKGRTTYDEFTALSDVTFDVKEGEVFGVIGENGSGKSTLLKCMAGILQPNSGSVRVHRRMSALLELGAGFHPELSGRDNVFLNAAILGMTRRDIAARFDDIVDFSGLAGFIDAPVKTYSSGMYVRLAFAVAINVDPRLLIIDEILAVGDVSFQQRCLEKFVEFRNEGRTIILVTHAMNTVKDMCDRAIWLTHGNITGEGDPSDLVDAYTETMLGDRGPSADGSSRRGSGEIQVTKVELFVGEGAEPVKRFRTGDSTRIRMTYRAEKTIPKPVVAFAIEALGSATVTAPCTRDVGLIPDTMSGEGTIDVRLDATSLLPGTYDLHTTITDFNRSHIYDNLHLALRFDVMSGKPYESGGLVTLRPQWNIN